MLLLLYHPRVLICLDTLCQRSQYCMKAQQDTAQNQLPRFKVSGAVVRRVSLETPELLLASESESRHPVGCMMVLLKTLKIVIFYQGS